LEIEGRGRGNKREMGERGEREEEGNGRKRGKGRKRAMEERGEGGGRDDEMGDGRETIPILSSD
jgi:hypothetical protein